MCTLHNFCCAVVPIITQGPIDTPAMMGDNVTFTCTATGIPLPTITWMDESIMLMGSDMIIDNTTILSTLTLSNLQNGVVPIIGSAIGYQLYRPCFLVSVSDR